MKRDSRLVSLRESPASKFSTLRTTNPRSRYLRAHPIFLYLLSFSHSKHHDALPNICSALPFSASQPKCSPSNLRVKTILTSSVQFSHHPLRQGTAYATSNYTSWQKLYGRSAPEGRYPSYNLVKQSPVEEIAGSMTALNRTGSLCAPFQ